MAFPTTVPADGNVHTEDGVIFVAESGKWKKRPGKRVLYSETPAGANGAEVIVPVDNLTKHIQVQCAFQMQSDGNVQFNVTKNGSWLSPFSASNFAHVNGSLSRGGDNWRYGDWAASKQPVGRGYWVNNADGNWKVGAGHHNYFNINFEEYDDGWSLFQWLLLYKRADNGVTRALGTGAVSSSPHQIKKLAFNTDTNFTALSAVVRTS